MDDSTALDPRAAALSVACLCADWCRTCDGYRPVLEQVVGEFFERGLANRPRWIDIEAEEDLIGQIDVETFPTVVVYDKRRVLFAGPLVPKPEHLHRILSIVALSASPAGPVDLEWEDLVARLRLEGAEGG
jgi:thioredoxin 1